MCIYIYGAGALRVVGEFGHTFFCYILERLPSKTTTNGQQLLLISGTYCPTACTCPCHCGELATERTAFAPTMHH